MKTAVVLWLPLCGCTVNDVGLAPRSSPASFPACSIDASVPGVSDIRGPELLPDASFLPECHGSEGPDLLPDFQPDLIAIPDLQTDPSQDLSILTDSQPDLTDPSPDLSMPTDSQPDLAVAPDLPTDPSPDFSFPDDAYLTTVDSRSGIVGDAPDSNSSRDLGAPDSSPKRSLGVRCGNPFQCASGHCTDGVCCQVDKCSDTCVPSAVKPCPVYHGWTCAPAGTCHAY